MTIANLGVAGREPWRGAPGKRFIGDDAGSAAGRAAELMKVRALQERHRAQQAEEQARSTLPAILTRLVKHTAGLVGAIATAPLVLVRAALSGARHGRPSTT